MAAMHFYLNSDPEAEARTQFRTSTEAPFDTMNRPRYRPAFHWMLRTRSLDLGLRTRLMAIVNLTPDSFSGDGLLGPAVPGLVQGASAASAKLAVATAVEAVDGGADIVDLGAESTRPDALPIGSDEEQARLLPVLEQLLQLRPQAIVSVDTYHAATARAALKAGAEIINDVSGLQWDEAMADVAAQGGCGLVLMHTRGRPTDWQSQPRMGDRNVVPTVFAALCERLMQAEAAGIVPDRIAVDPGFGFGKRGRENFALLAGLGRLHELGRPLLIGLSRKGFLGDAVRSIQPKALSLAEARKVPTAAAHVAAILGGAHILRVHDLQAAKEAAAIADAVLYADRSE
jgi:dihydropteroate synthase